MERGCHERECDEPPRERRLLLRGGLREGGRLDDRRARPEDGAEIVDVVGGRVEADDSDRHPVMLGDRGNRREGG